MIRELKPAKSEADLKKLLALYDEIFSTDEGLRFLTYTLKPFDRDTLVQWFTTHTKQGISYFGMTDDADLLGLCILQTDPVKGIELLGLMVRSAHRNKGIGRDLIRFAANHAKEKGFRVLDIHVFTDNKRMLRLAIDCDFIPVHITHRVRADGGDVLRLKHYLQSAD